MIIYDFDDFTNEQIKYFIKVVVLNPKIGDVEFCDDDILYICVMITFGWIQN